MSAMLAACAGNANETTTQGSMTVGGAAGVDNRPGTAGGGMRKNRPHVDTELAFGGDPNRTYDVALRVRGVVENRDYMSQGKKAGAWLLEQSGTELPKPGAIHVFGFTVRDPEKTFFFNSWNDVTTPARLVAVDYQATLPIRGGSKVRVFEYDDIGKIWANAAKLTVPELPPYPEAVEGQYLHFDVLSVTPRP